MLAGHRLEEWQQLLNLYGEHMKWGPEFINCMLDSLIETGDSLNPADQEVLNFQWQNMTAAITGKPVCEPSLPLLDHMINRGDAHKAEYQQSTSPAGVK